MFYVERLFMGGREILAIDFTTKDEAEIWLREQKEVYLFSYYRVMEVLYPYDKCWLSIEFHE